VFDKTFEPLNNMRYIETINNVHVVMLVDLVHNLLTKNYS